MQHRLNKYKIIFLTKLLPEIYALHAQLSTSISNGYVIFDNATTKEGSTTRKTKRSKYE